MGPSNKFMFKRIPMFMNGKGSFLVKTEDGKLIDVSIGASGHITEINVTAGDPINRKLPLALLQDDFVITGSD